MKVFQQVQGLVVTIIGPVGVGKSTQIRELERYFKSKDKHVLVTYIKTNHLLSYIVRRSLMTVGLQENVSYSDGIPRVFLRRDIVKKLFPLLSYLDTISIIVKFLTTVYVPFYLGATILIEEGLTMTLQTYLISYPFFYGTEPKVLPFLPRLLSWAVNKKHLTIVIDAVDEELDVRRKSRSYRRDEAPEFVSLQRKGIRLLSCENTVFIDTTNGTVESVHEEIIRAIEKTNPKRTT